MLRQGFIIGGALLALVASAPLQAQERGVPVPGDRVRVTTPLTARFTGSLIRWTPDSLALQVDGGHTRSLPREHVDRLEISSPRSRGSGALRGLGWGALIGAAGGAVFGAIVGTSDCSGGYCFGPGVGALGGAIVFAPLGAGTGAIVGTLRPGEGWTPAAHRAPYGSSQPVGSSSSQRTDSKTVRQPRQ